MQLKNQLGVIGILGGGESNSYSAEIEQTVSQENKDCENSLCGNNAAQIQAVAIIGQAQSGEPYSAEIEQTAEQENKMCHDGSNCTNDLLQIQGEVIVGGASGGPNSYYVEQEAVQKNFACFNSDCSNDLTQLQELK